MREIKRQIHAVGFFSRERDKRMLESLSVIVSQEIHKQATWGLTTQWFDNDYNNRNKDLLKALQAIHSNHELRLPQSSLYIADSNLVAKF